MSDDKTQIAINGVKYEIDNGKDGIISDELPKMEAEIQKLKNYFYEIWEADVDISIKVKKFRVIDMEPTDVYTWLGVRKL